MRKKGVREQPCPRPYLGACSCPVTDTLHQLYWIPKAQESKTQKQRQGGQQGIVLVDLDRQTLYQTCLLPVF